MSDEKLLYLFDRPTEPVYVPKGDDKVSFNVPPEFLVSVLIIDKHYANSCLN